MSTPCWPNCSMQAQATDPQARPCEGREGALSPGSWHHPGLSSTCVLGRTSGSQQQTRQGQQGAKWGHRRTQWLCVAGSAEHWASTTLPLIGTYVRTSTRTRAHTHLCNEIRTVSARPQAQCFCLGAGFISWLATKCLLLLKSIYPSKA